MRGGIFESFAKSGTIFHYTSAAPAHRGRFLCVLRKPNMGGQNFFRRILPHFVPQCSAYGRKAIYASFWPALSRTIKQAPNSSIDQGGGKRRSGNSATGMSVALTVVKPGGFMNRLLIIGAFGDVHPAVVMRRMKWLRK
jgi:hypothetical protein